jgi:hypothetical protein
MLEISSFRVVSSRNRTSGFPSDPCDRTFIDKTPGVYLRVVLVSHVLWYLRDLRKRRENFSFRKSSFFVFLSTGPNCLLAFFFLRYNTGRASYQRTYIPIEIVTVTSSRAVKRAAGDSGTPGSWACKTFPPVLPL